MSIYEKMIESYDNFEYLAGVPIEGKATLAPVAHMPINVGIYITIDADGKFITAEKLDSKDTHKIIIPMTEDAATRGSNYDAHPLCDQIGYVAGWYGNEVLARNPQASAALAKTFDKKHTSYLEQLTGWANDPKYGHPKVTAVYKYVCGHTIVDDLNSLGLLKQTEDGHIHEDDAKLMIGWIVEGLGDKSGPVWTDGELMSLYTAKYIEQLESLAPVYDMMTGQMMPPMHKHAKNLVRFDGNAKFISSNDSVNYTYRGLYCKAEQALTIGSVSSQKFHNFLKWIIANDAMELSSGKTRRIVLCWNPKGVPVIRPISPLLAPAENEKRTPTEYKNDLLKAVYGHEVTFSEDDDIVVAAFDLTSGNTGRLSLVYYNEMRPTEYFEKMREWDEICCCYTNYGGTFSPSLWSIVQYAFGYEKNENEMLVKDGLADKYMNILLSCKLEGRRIPLDVVRNLTIKSGRLIRYGKAHREHLLQVACAVIRKYHYDVYQEEISMALDATKKNRSYQFGRVAALFNQIERETFSKKENKRETTAIRLLEQFRNRPAETVSRIWGKVQAVYLPKLTPMQRIYYSQQYDMAMDIIAEFGDEEYNKPVDYFFTLGFSQQREEIRRRFEQLRAEKEAREAAKAAENSVETDADDEE